MDQTWRKSTYSGANPNCLECCWTKSSYSQGNGGNCLECRTTTSRVLIRDTQNRDQGHLSVPAQEWRAFLAAVRDREL